MDCPNDAVNDEKICQAVAGMLTRVGIKVNLLAQTKSKYFGKILLQAGNQTSMYMLGWTPSSTDAHNAAEPGRLPRRQDRLGPVQPGRLLQQEGRRG